MIDFAEWVHVASTFLRGMTHLPGRIDISDEIEPPATTEYDCGWLASDNCSLPPEIAIFLSSASRRCFFHYEWSPPPGERQQLSALFPNQSKLIGGGDFCEAAKYSNFDNRAWFEDFSDGFEESIGSAILGAAVSGHMEHEHGQGRLPLMELPNGDTISLQLEPTHSNRSVVYVRSDQTAEPLVLSLSFEQFLLDWRRLCYIQPSFDFLAPWIDAISGQLNLDCAETDALNELLVVSQRNI